MIEFRNTVGRGLVKLGFWVMPKREAFTTAQGDYLTTLGTL